jgi:hypothetical protein
MKSKLIYLALVGALFTSCQKDRLSPIPQTALSDEVAFSTDSRALQQVNGLYARLKSADMFVGRYQVHQDVRGEEFINNTNNAVTGLTIWNFTATPTENNINQFWGAAYATINRCNVVIEGLAGAPITEAVRKNYIAEAKFVRALSYYALMQFFASPITASGGSSLPGVPLRLTAITSSGSNDIERSTVGEVYAQIIKDLNEAEADIPLSYANADLNTTRAHRNTVIALKTRVYLAMGQYANVITEGNKIVSASAPFQASTGVPHRMNASISTTFTNYTTTESVLSMPFTAIDRPGVQTALNSYYNPGPNGIGDYVLNIATPGIVSNTDWKATDARRAFNQLSGTGATERLYLRKWPKNAGTDPDWIPVIRYSEVLLNVAEAEARQASGVSARGVEILNAVRQRSDATTTFAPASKDELINLILTERRIELLGEGFRTADIIRTGSTFPAKGAAPSVAPGTTLYIWPIPNSELLTNKVIDQNPGY